LVQSKNSAPQPKAAGSVETLTAKLTAAEAKIVSLKAIFAAENSRGKTEEYKTASLVAARREAESIKEAG